jgi:hypothetical protein
VVFYLFFEIRDLWKIIAGLEATEEEESGETFLHQHRGSPQISSFLQKTKSKSLNVDDQDYLLTCPQNYHGSPNYTLWRDPLNYILPEKKYQ